MQLPVILHDRSTGFWIAVSAILMTIVAALDYITGVELSFSLFYLLPVSTLTWFTKRSYGVVGSLASSLIWLTVNLGFGTPCYHPLTHVWNSLIRLTFFLIVTFLLSSLKISLERETLLARTDYLTGAINARAFYERLQQEIDRCQRNPQPFSIAYLDLDNFKQVNDRFGHAAGDQLLSTIVNYTTKGLRKTDVLARLGGDEFIILLPNTDTKSVQIVMAKLKEKLITEMQNQQSNVTFSIGVITCNQPPHEIEALLTAADNLMYEVKRDGKNNIYYLNWVTH